LPGAARLGDGAGGAMTGGGPAGRDGRAAVADELRRILADVTGEQALLGLAPDTALFGAGVGLDSLTGTLLLRRVRRRFGVDVAAEDLNLDCLASLAALAVFIAERAGAGG
jgi:acyl carrier protein